MGQRWTKREVSLLRNMVLSGASDVEIARKFDRTVRSVHCKIDRLLRDGVLQARAKATVMEAHHILPSIGPWATMDVDDLPDPPFGKRWVQVDHKTFKARK